MPTPERRADLVWALVQSLPDAVLAQDRDGRIQTWSRGAELLYGFTAPEVVGRSADLLFPLERTGEEQEILSRIRQGEALESWETTHRCKDASLIRVCLRIAPLRDDEGRIIGASQTARRTSERALLEAAGQLAAIVDNSEDAIISKDLNGSILTWNAGAERIYGYTAEEARHLNISALLPPDRQMEEERILERLKQGERVDHFETVRVCKDGREIDVSLTLSPIRDAGGAVRGASHIARNITARKELQSKLLQTQKLESLGILAGGVAHDFNNLLVGILANSSLLANALPVSNPQRKIMAEVVAAAERAAGLTRQLLAYAGKGRFVSERVDLSALIREINALIQTSIPPRVQVRLELRDELPAIEGDAGQLQQVVMNLIINGAEAIGDEPGLVVVTTSVQEVDERYAQMVRGNLQLKLGPYVVVEVNDSGCGMDEATLEKIFDPFFTTKFTGRGLGLAAVMGIVRGHKGALKVYTAPGQGSSFKLFFPVAGAVDEMPEVLPPGPELKGRGLVLVVDDEEVVRKAAQYTLQRYGYEVITAAEGQEAIEIFRRSPERIALVLLDLTMPKMTGEEVLRELQSVRPEVRVLLSSGFNEVEAVRRFTGKGLGGFIQKPYTAAALAAKAKQVLELPQRKAQPNADG